MNTFFAFLWFVANVVMIVFIVKAIKEKDADEKKQKRKVWLICLAVAVVAFIAFAATIESTEDKEETAIENTEDADSETDVNSEEQVADTEDSDETSDSEAIELIAGETGEYGREVVMSEGTEFEEHLIVYYLPAGTYTVTNLGEYRTQVSVYEGFAKNDETGYDEYTNTGDIVLLDVDGTDEIEIPEGWFIEIHEPTHISLVAK